MTPRPSFETPPLPGQERRRLLLISYHFPPDRTVGARRWEHLARFAVERGWGLDVITCPAPATPDDEARLAALPPGVRVFAVPQPTLLVERLEQGAWSAYLRAARTLRTPASAAAGGMTHSAARPLSIAREAIRWPPRRPRDVMRMYWAWAEYARYGRWADAAVRLARAIVQPTVHQAVITSGPPHMTHSAGRAVAEAFDLPFVMDMRDPWSLTPRLHEHMASPVWLMLARRHERRCLDRAALIVANNDPARNDLVRAHPGIEARTITVLNGTDDYPLPPTRHGERFVIRHAGTIYITSDVAALLRAAARVIRARALSPERFGIDFIGAVDLPGETTVAELARREGVAEFVTVGTSRPHAEALEFLSHATMLAIFSGFGAVTLPAKTFEYIRFDAWILAMGGRGSALDLLLRGTDADVVAPDDVDAMTDAIDRRYAQFLAGERPVRIAHDGRFGRARQATILFDALQAVLTQRAPRRD